MELLHEHRKAILGRPSAEVDGLRIFCILQKYLHLYKIFHAVRAFTLGTWTKMGPLYLLHFSSLFGKGIHVGIYYINLELLSVIHSW